MSTALQFVKDEVAYRLSYAMQVLRCPRRSIYRYMNSGELAYEAPTPMNPHRRITGAEIKRFHEAMKFKKGRRSVAAV